MKTRLTAIVVYAVGLALAGPARAQLADAGPAPADDTPSEEPTTVSGFAGIDWRVTGQAEHLGHGPGFQTGVLLWQRLKVGLAGHARPGPINPQTFERQPADGQTYKGQSTVTLRSDGAFIGLLVAPVFPVLKDDIWLEVPLVLGQGAYGFYLTGSDRDTPDGRRVSDWENELLDGRDSAVALGIDAGVRRIRFPPGCACTSARTTRSCWATTRSSKTATMERAPR